MLSALLKSLRTGVVTVRVSPEPPPRFRGAPHVRPGAVFADLPAASICPTGAITGGPGEPTFAIDLARCMFCGRCASPSAPSADGAGLVGEKAVGGHLTAVENAIELGREVELASRRREHLVIAVESGPDGRAELVAAPPPAEAVAAQIRRTLGRSLALRHLDSGSCNACDWELNALLNPVYDVRRLGIDFAASPRHSDGVIVTGSVTRNLEAAVRRTYEAVPEPRVVIAVGACAASGGIAGRSYASAGGVDHVLPVDVFIPGCPPRPQAIIFGILLAVGRIEERKALSDSGEV